MKLRATLAAVLGLVSCAALAQSPLESATRAADAYNNWKLALPAGTATDPATITAPAGFRVELLRSAAPDEDSWVSMAFDPQGRLTIGCEKKGLLRMTFGAAGVERVERINDTLLECRGLLYAHGALYANANNSKVLVRLRSTGEGDALDEITELLRTEGGVGHGRNQLTLGPDGLIYIAHGNNVIAPPQAAASSPLRNFRDDRLIPCAWDAQMFDGDVKLPAGHVLRTDGDGKEWTLLAGGFRNQLDVGFNEEGEMFTFDADMEWDFGTPWYRPNRVNHVISGADYGWRRGTSKWPEYFPDSGPTVLNIGLASPTAVLFGTGARFPEKWRRAFFICDWAYGRIIAVHLRPRGASYTATAEPFVTGRPLNVTDAVIGPDGAMYFLTGGRRTQAGLYRVSYIGKDTAPEARSAEVAAAESAAAEARALRRSLESLHGRSTPGAVEKIWPHLRSGDPWIRHAARIALEAQQVHAWQEKALHETDTSASLTALLALARCGGPEVRPPLLARLDALPFPAMADDLQLLALRTYQLALIRLGDTALPIAAGTRHRLEALYPARSWPANHLLCELLIYLQSPTVLAKTLPLLTSAERSEDLLHYLFFLRHITTGWSIEDRRSYFTALARAEKREGARNYQWSLRLIRSEAAANLSPEERLTLGPLLEPAAAPDPAPNSGPQVAFREWKTAELLPKLDRVARGRSFASGRLAFTAANCAACHRLGDAGGILGPDLTAVASRFSRRDLLDAILEPSRVIDDKYRLTSFTMNDGTTVTGAIDHEDDRNVTVRSHPSVTLSKKLIASRALSDTSPMPSGLLNVLTENQLLDLLAYVESGGDPQHPFFRR